MPENAGIAYISHRVELALERRPVLPELAVTYRLCEVGAPRIDAHILGRHLTRLCAEGIAVSKTTAGLYVRPDLSSAEAGKHSRRTLKALRALGLNYRGKQADQVAILSDAVDDLRRELDVTGRRSSAELLKGLRNNVADVPVSAVTFEIQRAAREAPIAVQVTCDSDWVYPNSPEFWRHLRDAAETGSHPVFVARKVAPITFPLLAALNARALQYYGVLVAFTPDSSQIALADELGLPRLLAARDLSSHAMFSQLLRQIDERPAEIWKPALDVAFSDAIARGFADKHVPPGHVAAWAEAHADLNNRWVQGVRSWANGRAHKVEPRVPRTTNHGPTVRQKNERRRKTEVTRVPFRI